MKAFHVFCGGPGCESLLVFAETANKARFKAMRYSPFGSWDWNYIEIRALRVPKWDEYATKEKIIETNSDLPKDAPPFYDDSLFE